MKVFIKKIIFLIGLQGIYDFFYYKNLENVNTRKFNIDKDLINKIKNKQKLYKNNYKYFKFNPKIAFVLTSYNHINNATKILNSLRNIPADEIIVCDDGSIDGARELWLKILDRPNEILICTNELNEAFCLDRAFRSSNADILCSLQDDDILPENNNWVKEALNIFEYNNDLVILGGNGGNIFDNPSIKISNYNSFGYSEEIRKKSLNENKKKINEIPSGLIPNVKKFMFVHVVNLGPFFIKREFYNNINGYNLEQIGVGNHLIGMDWDLCFKAWKNNKQVGLFEIKDIKQRVGGNMSSILSSNKRENINKLNMEFLNKLYNRDNFLTNTEKKIRVLNNKINY